MRNFAKIAFVLTVTLLVSGCASKGPPTFNENKSRALNLVEAAGINSLRDTKVPKDTVNTLMKSDAADLGFLVSSAATAPIPGLTGFGSFGVGLALNMLGPKDPASRNSIFGWMPEEIGHENPSSEFRHLLGDSLEKGLGDLDYGIIQRSDVKNRSNGYNSFFHVVNEDAGCQKEAKVWEEVCYIRIEVYSSKNAPSPNFVGENSVPS